MGIDAEMYAITKAKLTDEQILKLAFRIGATFGAKNFIRWAGGYSLPAHHNISRVAGVIEQDGPGKVIPVGHTGLHIHVATRYYGKGYERGDLPFLVMVAEWMEVNIPDCEVWYGGDSSGVLAEPFGPKERKELIKHFCSPNGRDYFNSFGGFGSSVGAEIPICPTCKEPMPDCGGERGASFHLCAGCGRKVIARPGKKDFVVKWEHPDNGGDGDDFFKASERMKREDP